MRDGTIEPSVPGDGLLAELRGAFDRSFAEAPIEATAERVDLLAVRIGAHPFAIRLSDAAGLITDRRVTPVPTTVRELRGVAGVRGAVIPVYDLAMLLGLPPTAATRWLLVARGAAVAFVVDSFEGQLRVEPGAIAPNDTTPRAYVREVVSAESGSRPVVNMTAVVAAIGERASGFKPSREA